MGNSCSCERRNTQTRVNRAVVGPRARAIDRAWKASRRWRWAFRKITHILWVRRFWSGYHFKPSTDKDIELARQLTLVVAQAVHLCAHLERRKGRLFHKRGVTFRGYPGPIRDGATRALLGR